ncbi:MAG: hypothetical protein ACJ70W_06250 [Nitrososphaera sp.]
MNNLRQEEGLLDSAIVFALSDRVINTAISSVKRGCMLFLEYVAM